MATFRPLSAAGLALIVSIGIAGCSPTFRNHGYVPPEEDLSELVVGIDTRSTVEDVVGPLKHLLWGAIFFFTKNCREGAQTTIYCAVDERAGKETGLYYSDCRVKLEMPQARDDEMAEKLWEASVKATGL